MTGDDVRALRERCGMTQQRFSTALGISTSAVQKWEEGSIDPRGLSRVVLSIVAEATAKVGPEEVASALLSSGDPAEVLKAVARLTDRGRSG